MDANIPRRILQQRSHRVGHIGATGLSERRKRLRGCLAHQHIGVFQSGEQSRCHLRLSGHQMLQRRSRSICYLGRVTDDFDEKRVAAVWLKVSNNGQAEGRKTALQLADDATLQPIDNFDWAEWQASSSSSVHREPKVNEGHLRDIFDDGRRGLVQKDAAAELMERAEVGRSAAYDALKLIGGRFSHVLVKREGRLWLTTADPSGHDEEI